MKQRIIKLGGRLFLAGFVLLNVVAAIHAYKFTHFTEARIAKSRIDNLGLGEKASVLFTGISNPRPANSRTPSVPFETFRLRSGDESLEGWWIPVDQPKGTVILFHGYASQKSSMLEKAREIRRMGYETVLIDFAGSGGSSGSSTTIGFFEAEEVLQTYRYVNARQSGPIYLMGISMGSVAIMKAVRDHEMEVEGLILECPFGSLLETTCVRFRSMGVPSFPAAWFLVFWGGLENGFWGFAHNPDAYAREINVPVLLVYGEKDKRVQRFETDAIYANLSGPKKLLLFPSAGHGNYLTTDRKKWETGISEFLSRGGQ